MRDMTDATLEDAIAIIGMSACFPGDNDSRSIWQVLESGVTTATRFTNSELDSSLPETLIRSSNYVPVRGILSGAEFFDSEYFGFSAREAEILDPQQRLFLQLAVHALEDAGYYRKTIDISTGVYAGMSNITYFRNHLAQRPEVLERVGELNAMMANEKDYLATRVAHKLDLTGPCINISTACSTSAVAIAQAFYALQTYQCDLALAGGISVTTPQNRGYVYQDGGILSPDGVCRPFDARAQGTYFSNGGGIIVLKRLQEAIADEDNIVAIVRGVGVNNDGAKRASFAAPGVEGQAEAVAQALANAEVDAGDIGLLEAHGTATPIGDPIEVEALKMAFREYTADSGYCAIGSIKSNLGHLDVAGGVAGVIKAVLCLQAGKIPPTANYQTPNPELRLEETPFFVNDQCIDWPLKNGPRLAGVSSFGSGGTNAHLILQQAPERGAPTTREPELNVVTLSARTDTSLSSHIEQIRNFSIENPALRLADVAHSLREGRRDDECRFAVVADSLQTFQDALDNVGERPRFVQTHTESKKIAFVFPGQGSQYAGMGKALYASNDRFRAAMDTCFALFDSHLDDPLSSVIFGEENTDNTKLDDTAFTQPALFTIGYALTQLYAGFGIHPQIMLGHSIGEYLAGHLAGVFSLEDAIAVVATRGRLMQSMAPGAMLAVPASAEDVEPMLPSGVSIASFNSRRSTVVAGTVEAISEMQAACESRDIMARIVRTSHAFHTPMMERAADQLTTFLDGIQKNPPTIPFVSTVSGEWITADEVVTSEYWGDQIRNPVRFSQAATFLVNHGSCTFLEMGPRMAAVGFLRQHISDKSAHAAIPALDTENGQVSESAAIANALARLWERGHDPDWDALLGNGAGRRIPMPGYAFAARRHWIEAIQPGQTAPVLTATGGANTGSDPEQASENSDGASSLSNALRDLVADMIGIDPGEIDNLTDFVDLGFDSLLLTQLSIAIKREFSTQVAFRRLLEDLGTFSSLLSHIESNIPGQSRRRFSGSVKLQEAGLTPAQAEPQSGKDAETAPSRGASIARSRSDQATEGQQKAIQKIVSDYVRKTAASKQRTQDGREVLSDPRTVSGFNPMWKEAVYPIVTDRSSGAYVWDIDGNRFIDFTCGFGPILLGHGPEFLKKAVVEQIESGIETGPQSPLALDVAKLISEATGVERVAFASTGTEAVIAAARIARTVTAKSKILIFAESYHGIHDEVTVNPRHLRGAAPGAPGIPGENVQNVLVARYGSDEALAMVEENADSLAAVLVEPVQSRNPALQPGEFLKKLRDITEIHDIALIFDEIVTGFRVALGGAQSMFNIEADIVTYGKVIGGGYPLGVVAGKGKYLDALDGGYWEFGDESVPEAGVTFFAGTFVRHPLMLAAAKANLAYLLEQGPVLQESLNGKSADLCAQLVTINRKLRVNIDIARCSSWFVMNFASPVASAMFHILMRDHGIFIWEGRAFFLNAAHSDEDLQNFVEAYEMTLSRLIDDELLTCGEIHTEPTHHGRELDASKPPVPGARIGKDNKGRPRWFVEDPDAPGKYRIVDSADISG